MIDAALALAERGWAVFPCNPHNKRPLFPKCEHAEGLTGQALADHADGCPMVGHGLWDATTDPDSVAAWWVEHPDAFIGVNCGRSGLAVIDIDDWDGYAQACDEHGDLPVTLSSETPSGGAHLIFTGDIKSTVSKVAPGVDTRGRGGYIIAPPSPGYGWVQRQQPAELPEVWAEAADPPRPEPAPAAEPTGEANSRWGQRILESEIARVATAAEGTRNHTLFESACNIFEAVKGGHLDEGVARAHLESVGARIGLGRGEIEAAMSSAWDRTDARHPSPLPESSPPREDSSNSEDGDMFDGLDLDQLRNLPPPRWILEPLIPEGLTFVVGPPKVGKTFVTVDWSLTAAAAGTRVLYFVGEGVGGFATRVGAWADQHPQADLSRLTVIPRAPQLLDPADVQRLHRTVVRKDIDLVVIDTLSRATRGADENSHVDMSNAIGVLDDLRDQHGLRGTLLVHHTNAAGERPRGHSALQASYEAMWQVQSDDALAGTLTVKSVAFKDHEPTAPLYGQIREHGSGAVIYPSVYGRRL